MPSPRRTVSLIRRRLGDPRRRGGRFCKALGDIGCGLGDIRRFLVTHAHRDHHTQAMAVRRRFPRPGGDRGRRAPNIAWCRIAHSDDIERAELPLLRRAGATRARRPRRAAPVRAVQPTTGAPTPGSRDGARSRSGRGGDRAPYARSHPRASRLPRRPCRTLFAGDHVLPHITPSIGFEPARPSRLCVPISPRSR